MSHGTLIPVHCSHMWLALLRHHGINIEAMNVAYQRTSDGHSAVACYVQFVRQEADTEDRRNPLMLAAAQALSSAAAREDATRAARRPPRPEARHVRSSVHVVLAFVCGRGLCGPRLLRGPTWHITAYDGGPGAGRWQRTGAVRRRQRPDMAWRRRASAACCAPPAAADSSLDKRWLRISSGRGRPRPAVLRVLAVRLRRRRRGLL